MPRVKNSQIALALVCMVLGVMLSVQFKVQQSVASSTALQRTEDLARRLREAEKDREDLQKEVSDLRAKMAQMAEGKNVIANLTSELDRTRVMAGLVDVFGPGVVVVMDDSKRPRKPGEDPNAFIIHDDDILSVVNELRAAGAEAISINGQRVVTTTEIRCLGPVISINGVRTAPPIEIIAIGDPQTLEAGLRIRDGIIDNLGVWGILVTVKREEKLVVPAYKGPVRFQFAQPVKKE